MFTRKTALFLALALAVAPFSSALAAQQGGFTNGTAPAGIAASSATPSGFTGPGPAGVTVRQAEAMSDDTPVAMQGSIVQSLGNDKYLFRDATGTMTVDIDHDKWNGQYVGPNDVVDIQGEIDKGWTSTEVDVDRVIKR